MSDTAPGELELVRLFVNTVDLEDGDDELSSPDALAGWLEAHRLGGGSAGSADLHAARRLREAIRGLLLENSGMNVRKESALTLSPGGGARTLRRSLRPGRQRDARAAAPRGWTEPSDGSSRSSPVRWPTGPGAASRPARPTACGWAFYDHARNRSRRWCSMAVCGNRTKARSYRRRHAA